MGEKQNLSEEILEDFSNTGLMHVLAVSGLHVGLIGLIFFQIFSILRFPRIWIFLSVIPVLWAYAAITGFGPSVVRAALASNLARTRVVTGHQGETVKAQLAGLDVDFAHSPHYAEGLSASLKAGLDGLGEDYDGILVLLGDMPKITPAHIDRLIAAFNPLEGRAICVPTLNGKRGNPVLFAIDLAGEMAAIAGDVGAKSLIGRHEDVVCEVAMADDAIFLDIDTPTALARVRGKSD